MHEEVVGHNDNEEQYVDNEEIEEETTAVTREEEDGEIDEESKNILEMLRYKLENLEELEGVNLRYEERKKVRESTKFVDDVISKIDQRY